MTKKRMPAAERRIRRDIAEYLWWHLLGNDDEMPDPEEKAA